MLFFIKVEKNRMIPITSMEPMNAPIMTDRNPDKVNTPAVIVPAPASMTKATPKLAPELMPKYGRIGQRIIECGLQHQSRCCECHSAKEGGNGLRQAGFPDYETPTRLFYFIACKDMPHRLGRNVYRTEQQVGSCQCKDEEEQYDTVFCSFVIH